MAFPGLTGQHHSLATKEELASLLLKLGMFPEYFATAQTKKVFL
jgi:hypothetical protein